MRERRILVGRVVGAALLKIIQFSIALALVTGSIVAILLIIGLLWSQFVGEDLLRIQPG